MLPGAAATSEPAVRSAARADSISERWFYVRMAYACAAIAVVGFTPTYWAPLVTGRFPVSTTGVLHAFTAVERT